MKNIIIVLAMACCMVACGPKRATVSEMSVQGKHIPVFVEMPRNVHVFDDIAPLLYQALHHQYMRVGYDVVDRPARGYKLLVQIKNLEPTQKLVSPEVNLVHYHARLELDCTLRNFNDQIVAQKKLFVSGLISKPKNPILNSDFLDYEYKRLCSRAASQIERHFKLPLIKAFTTP